ncbi:histidinol dehydrogenase [Alistipes sp.]|uniref:histidinol dehydrogenase n=1 Tax=Alistipes sp. TaxID=1872444 RepID=UPI0023F0EC10|nr:histidinol dehydrogenase [Alistipes sp.]
MEMPKIYVNPPRSEWPALTARCTRQEEEIGERVAAILAEVRTDGDAALRRIVRRIEGYLPETFEVTRERRAEAAKAVSQQLKAALEQAKANIEAFHRAQLPAQVEVETMPGVRCVQRAVAIGRAGLYIPGGKAPLFSTVLMLALPARIAGCREVILCTPCGRDGRIAPEILYAADLCGVDRVFALGGAQAVAAMAYGTESIPRVDKIFGPGNRYVTKAKQLAGAADVAVDLPAGPSEVLVLADEDARPEFAAADLLSQAEHGDDSQAVLVCRSEEFARRAIASVGEQAARLSRRDAIGNSLANSRIVVFSDPDEQIAFADAYAPEHLIVAMRDAWDAAARITAAGSVFIGGYSPESAGDYASGTNHTLPTGGWARAYSGVNTESFMRKITYQELTRGGLEALAPTITAMAEAEGLDAHANAVRIRTEGGAR